MAPCKRRLWPSLRRRDLQRQGLPRIDVPCTARLRQPAHCWRCDLEVWVRTVGRLTPSTFLPAGAGGLADLGSRRLPRMRSLADEITAAATRKALRKACKTRALVRDSTYIERGLAPPITFHHARTPDRRVARANERAQPLASNRGSAAAACADKQSVSAPTLEARRLWAALNRAAG